MLRALTRPLLLGLLLALGACGRERVADCSLVKVTALPLRMENGLPLVRVVVNGTPTWFIADSGAARSVLTESARTRLGLPEDQGHLTQTIGVGGATTAWDARIDSLVIGGVRFPVERMAVGRFTIGHDPATAPAGLLGADILLAFDLDIDLGKRTLTLYRARMCPDGQPPWQEAAVAIPGVARENDRLVLPVLLDGAEGMALLDTGAQDSVVGSRMAERMGLTPDATAQDPIVGQHGAGPAPVEGRRHRFARLAVGPTVMHEPELTILPSDGAIGDGVLGQDFMKGRRLWVSFASKQVFIAAPHTETLVAAR
ncbi:MAG: hypothetical protein BGO51_19295 [Rhodospirillales bacterium 69-11]|nr:MAG: hypothetical protein BGO51_19295 [Rhodospirillales bacterium 69-11]